MTNAIMKLAEVYAWRSVHGAQTNGEGVMEARAALEQAVQAQADEIERLKDSPFSEEAFDILRGENRMLRAKLDAATKVPLSADVLNSLWGDAVAVGDPTAGNLHIRYARAVEAHHNIKGTTL